MALGGAILGLVARYSLPHRSTHGSVLVPAIGTAVAMVAWVVLTWLGWAWDGGWIWWVSLGAALVVAVAADIWLGRQRVEHDQRMLHTLMKKGVPARA